MHVHIVPPAPVNSVNVVPRAQVLGDTQAGRDLAARLGHAASTFDIVNGRAVQMVALDGSRIDGMEER